MFFDWRRWNKRSNLFPTEQLSSCSWSHWSFSFWFWRWRRLTVVCARKQRRSKGPSCVSPLRVPKQMGWFVKFYAGRPFYGGLKHNCSSVDVTNVAAERRAVSAHQLRRRFEGECMRFGGEKGASVCMSKGLRAVGNWGHLVSRNYPKRFPPSVSRLWRRMLKKKKKILDSTNFSFRRIEKLVLFWIFLLFFLFFIPLESMPKHILAHLKPVQTAVHCWPTKPWSGCARWQR